jgi:hypothetical protein
LSGARSLAAQASKHKRVNKKETGLGVHIASQEVALAAFFRARVELARR